MSRPKLRDDQLKNPRISRKSPTTGIQLDIPPPSAKEKRKWQWLVVACVRAVLATNRVDNIAPKVRVAVYFSDFKKQQPSFFPKGRFVKREGKSAVVEYASDMLLLVLWEHKLADYNPHMLHTAKKGLLSEYEKIVDNVLEFELDL